MERWDLLECLLLDFMKRAPLLLIGQIMILIPEEALLPIPSAGWKLHTNTPMLVMLCIVL